MSDIFVSYASEDREKNLPLVRALEQTGWSIFWDRTIPVGKTWRQVVGDEIETWVAHERSVSEALLSLGNLCIEEAIALGCSACIQEW